MIKYIILVIFFIISFSQNQVHLMIPTVDDETNYVWQNIINIEFFEANNYQITFPKDALIDSLINKSKRKQLTDDDYNKFRQLMKKKIYREAEYQIPFEKTEAIKDELNRMITELKRIYYKWSFKVFTQYKIILTFYGPGGSYNPHDGSIIIFATKEGKFKSYDNPLNTLIHEVIHIGIDESIITKFKLNHSVKERIVDLFVMLNFKNRLPNYRLQALGDDLINPYLATKESLIDLQKHVKHYIKEN